MGEHYMRGEMDISEQKSTFHDFMGWVEYGGATIAMLLLYPILMFCANLPWAYALIATVIVALIIGRALKFKPSWFALVIVAALLIGVPFGLLSLMILA